jgi:predicted ATP-binding protein involved in virulence
MKLSKVEITNFRCFESLRVELQRDVNVFVGVNGSGKTAILDAIAIGLYEIVAANGGGGKKQRVQQKVGLRPTDIQIVSGSGSAIAGRKDYVQVKSGAIEFYEVEGFPRRTPLDKENVIEWTDHILYQPPSGFIYDKTQSERLSSVHKYFATVWREVRKSDPRALIAFPAVAYYRANRRISEMPTLDNVFEVKLEPQGAYQNALNAGANYDEMCKWFYLRENAELREKVQKPGNTSFEFPDLRAVRHALIRALEGVKRVFFDENPPSLKVAFDGAGGAEKAFELEQLSDGYRNLLAVVLDFARRLAQANPAWPNPLEAPGIMVIDEIDLHLHPTWQQKIVPNLRGIFPNTQLIVATHSPYVVTTVESRCVQIVDAAALRPCPAPTFGARSSDVVSEVMGLHSQRPPGNPIAEKISALFAAIDDSDLAKAKSIRAELSGWANGFPEPDLVRADLMIKRLETKPRGKDAGRNEAGT